MATPSDLTQALESQVDILARWLVFFTGLVVLGLMLEYGGDAGKAAGAKWTSKKLFLNLWVPIWIVLGGILVVGGVAGELYVEFFASRAENSLRELRDSANAVLRKEAGDAIDRASHADQKAETLRQENIVLQAEVLRLRKESEPRRLTGWQKKKLVALLEQNPDSAVVVSAIIDSESSDFADDFDSALNAAKWKTLRVVNRITRKYGVMVGVVPGTNRPGAKRLSEALTAIGVLHEDATFKEGDASTSPAFQAGYIYLVIEHKPRIKKKASQ
jgi:hypothetical protein